MSAHSLYEDIRSYLLLNYQLIQSAGAQINVNENFTMRFTVTNIALFDGGREIVFLNPRVFVSGTNYAVPSGGDAWHTLPEPALFSAQSSSVDVVFTAIASYPWWASDQEPIASVAVFADLDQSRFFRIRNNVMAHVYLDPT